MRLLMAVQVYQFPIAVSVGPTYPVGLDVMPMEFLSIQERHPAYSADPVLCTTQLLVPGGQAVCTHFLPLSPVFPETGVIGRSRAAYERMPHDLEPVELQEIVTGALVS